MQTKLDIAWVIVCAALVFTMQAGFLCLETGLTRVKNSINVALKNLTDFGISMLLFWAFGAGLMFGTSHGGLFGLDGLFPVLSSSEPEDAAFFLFQVMFCGTSVTIVSGAVAERMRFRGYLLVVVLQSGFLYTLFGHWAWNGLSAGTPAGWLAARGFVDFAGSSVVHSVGGWVSLAVVLVLGPRRGRFTEAGAQHITGSSLPLAMLGTLLIWFGWFGFNGGSTLALNDQVPSIVANTALAGASGMMTALFLGWRLKGYPDVGHAINGVLSGLVAVTASCHAVTAPDAVLIGAVGAVIAMIATWLLERWRIDDVVGAMPVHAGAGVWGTVAVALFGDPERLGTGLDRIDQLEVQLLGVGTCFVWAFGVSYLLIAGLNRIRPLRIDEEAEKLGLNVAEHNETTELLDLFQAMDEQAREGDIQRRVRVEPFTEVGQIASHYNRVLDALQRAIARTQLIVDNAFDGIVTFTKSSLTIERLNPSAAAMFGYAPSGLVGQPVQTLVAVDHGPFEPLLNRPPGGGPSGSRGHPDELLGRRSDGSTFPMEVVVTEIAEGQDLFYTGTFRDITQRRRIQEALREAKEAAESASQMKSQFLASMSHELRTPLNAIIGYSEMLQEEAEEAGQPSLVADLRKIHAAGKHLLQLINDVLDLSKIEAGKVDLFLETFAVEDLVHEVVVMLEPLIARNQNKFGVRCDPEVGSMHADATRVRQCLFNLLGNASKFARGGEVALTVELAAGAGEPAVSFQVRDTGIGMTPPQLEALFQPFTQADASTTRHFGGTGLGLAITQRFCEMMGGTVSARSEPERGSTFTLVIPRNVVPRALDVDRAAWSAVSARSGAAPAPMPRATILAIDDDPSVRDLLERFLTREGYRVVTAPTGEEGLRLAAELRPSAITLDVVMPQMDGWAVLRALKTDPKLSHIPVVIVTMTDDMAQGLALGAADFLVKPVDRARLLKIVEKIEPRVPPTRVLVVEDDPASREMLTKLLGNAGCRASVATNGVEALGELETSLPDLILLDLMMPEMNGFELAAAVREDERWRSIPIVVITAKELTHEDRERLEGHVARVFRKGTFSRDELLGEIGALLERQMPASGRS